jgi:dienelactone hydrolase
LPGTGAPLPHNTARRVFINAVVRDLARQRVRDLGGQRILQPGDEEDLRAELAAAPAIRSVLDVMWPELTPQQLLTQLYQEPHRLDLTDDERAAIARDTPRPWTPADVPVLDELAELLGTLDATERAARRRRAADEAERTETIKYAAQIVARLAADEAIVLPPLGVPGVLWSLETSARPPAVLLGHGGSGHKRRERHLRMGRWLASTAGLAVVAIDGPCHGDRVSSPMDSGVYQQLIVDEGMQNVTARMTEDWLETVSALAAEDLVDHANISAFGMSMGARFGLPVAAALGSRLRCAVFGKFGVRQTGAIHPGLCCPELMVTAARAISAPVLFHVQWDDEVFPRDGQFGLFGTLASDDKRLFARSGRHAETHPDDEASWHEFLRRNAPVRSS